MKRNLVLAAAIMLVLASAGGVSAMGQERVHAKIPFQFVVRDRVMNAGDYELYTADETDPGTMVIRAATGGAEETFLVEPVEGFKTAPASELIFDVVDSTRFLRQIRIAGERVGQEITPCEQEQELLGKGVATSEHRIPAELHHHRAAG